MAEEMKNVSDKVRYSDEELQEFKAIIIEMLEKAKRFGIKCEYGLDAHILEADASEISDIVVLL